MTQRFRAEIFNLFGLFGSAAQAPYEIGNFKELGFCINTISAHMAQSLFINNANEWWYMFLGTAFSKQGWESPFHDHNVRHIRAKAKSEIDDEIKKIKNLNPNINSDMQNYRIAYVCSRSIICNRLKVYNLVNFLHENGKILNDHLSDVTKFRLCKLLLFEDNFEALRKIIPIHLGFYLLKVLKIILLAFDDNYDNNGNYNSYLENLLLMHQNLVTTLGFDKLWLKLIRSKLDVAFLNDVVMIPKEVIKIILSYDCIACWNNLNIRMIYESEDELLIVNRLLTDVEFNK